MSHCHHTSKFLNLLCGPYLKISTEHEVQPLFSFSSLVKQAILWKKPLSYAEFSWCLPKYSYPLKGAQDDRHNLNNEYQAYCIAKQYYYYETKATAIKKDVVQFISTNYLLWYCFCYL